MENKITISTSKRYFFIYTSYYCKAPQKNPAIYFSMLMSAKHAMVNGVLSWPRQREECFSRTKVVINTFSRVWLCFTRRGLHTLPFVYNLSSTMASGHASHDCCDSPFWSNTKISACWFNIHLFFYSRHEYLSCVITSLTWHSWLAIKSQLRRF